MDQITNYAARPGAEQSSGALDGLSSLDVDVIIEILALLNVRDIIALRQVRCFV